MRRLLALPLLAAGAALVLAGVGLCALAVAIDPDVMEPRP